jgi:hypothetical protein
MTRICRWRGLCGTGLGLAFLMLSGCQTWMAGMTLPSPYYLIHPPQYIPPSPPFPLPRELSSQEAAWAAPVTGAAPAVPLPPALPQVPPAAAPEGPAAGPPP